MVANDTARLLMELETIAATLIPSADIVKLKIRFEEVTNNYNVELKTNPIYTGMITFCGRYILFG